MTTYLITNTRKFIGLSSDSKPNGVPVGSTFLEYDTQSFYITPDGGNTWTLKEAAQNPVAITSIDLNQLADNYTLFTAINQDLFIDFLVIIIPRDLTGELLDAISIQSTDIEPVVFVSEEDGAVENLTAGKHLVYRGPDIVAATKEIQLTIHATGTAEECICPVYVSYRPAVAGGYLQAE